VASDAYANIRSPMAYPDFIRAKARKVRVEKRLSIDEIAERLALPKTTIYYWVRDLPLDRPRREKPTSRYARDATEIQIAPRGCVQGRKSDV
jgi:hypothetical protein